MPFYWSIAAVPELAPFDGTERQRIWRAAYAKSRRQWRSWIGIAVSIPVMFAAMAPQWLGVSVRFPWSLPFQVAAIWAAVFLMNHFTIRAALPYIREQLGRCRNCGYDLRGSPDRCPECGTPVNHSARP